MSGLHLHPTDRNAPFRRIKVEFRPFGSAQLPRANKSQWRELQRRLNYKRALVAIYCSHQRSDTFWVCDAREASFSGRCQRSRLWYRICLKAMSINRVLKDRVQVLANSVYRLDSPSIFNKSKHFQQLWAREIGDWQVTDVGVHIFVEPVSDAIRITLDPSAGLLGKPLCANCLQRVG